MINNMEVRHEPEQWLRSLLPQLPRPLPTPYPAVSSLQLERNQTNVTMPKNQPGSCPHVMCGNKTESCSPV